MELEPIIQELLVIGNRLLQKVNLVDCYLFGSILVEPKLANDIDILIIYDNESQIKIIKEEFEYLSKEFPLHMNYFTPTEEKELNFIAGQNAKKIFGC
jgi:predicted nucleotidyltransferase